MEPHFDVLIALARPAAADTLEVSPREVAHSISIMVMTAFLMESNAGRLAALGRLPRASVTGGRSTPGTDLDAVDLIRDALSDAPEDRAAWESVHELFVVRDVLAHNHVLRIVLQRPSRDWDTSPTLQDVAAIRGRVNTVKYRSSVDPSTFRTKLLGLHVIPTMVRRWDVAQSLPIVVSTLDRLADCDIPNMRSLADDNFRIGGRLTTLRDVAVRLGAGHRAGRSGSQ